MNCYVYTTTNSSYQRFLVKKKYLPINKQIKPSSTSSPIQNAIVFLITKTSNVRIIEGYFYLRAFVESTIVPKEEGIFSKYAIIVRNFVNFVSKSSPADLFKLNNGKIFGTAQLNLFTQRCKDIELIPIRSYKNELKILEDLDINISIGENKVFTQEDNLARLLKGIDDDFIRVTNIIDNITLTKSEEDACLMEFNHNGGLSMEMFEPLYDTGHNIPILIIPCSKLIKFYFDKDCPSAVGYWTGMYFIDHCTKKRETMVENGELTNNENDDAFEDFEPESDFECNGQDVCMVHNNNRVNIKTNLKRDTAFQIIKIRKKNEEFEKMLECHETGTKCNLGKSAIYYVLDYYTSHVDSIFIVWESIGNGERVF